MPLPFLAVAAVGVGLTGIFKGGKAISNNSKANDLIESAEWTYNDAKDTLEYQKNSTVSMLDKLGETMLNSWSNDIGEFIPLFNSFKKVQVEKKGNINLKLKDKISSPRVMKNMQVASLKATEVLGTGVSALGAGALAGIASYGGAMMFASASTGTAIASLSGAAATNATLAWFGGGSLAAGGLGVAGGTVVLGGVVAAPVIAVAGFIMEAKSQEKLAQAQKVYAEAENAAAKMATMTSALKVIYDIADMDNDFIQVFSLQYHKVLNQLATMRDSAHAIQEKYLGNRIRKLLGLQIKVDYRKLTTEQQQTLHIAWLMTQLLYSTLTTPILAKNGDLDEKSKEKIYALKNESQRFLEA